MRQKWHIFIRCTYFRKCEHLLENIDIYSEMWTYISKYGSIFQNVDIYPKIWTQCQKSGRNYTKMDKILENETFDLSKSGKGYSVGA